MMKTAPKSRKRFDFMDPDFGVKTSLRMASNRKQRSKCRINTELGSEIPELGLDTGRVNLDCYLNPVRMANAAARVARNYSQMRQQRKRANQQPYRSADSHLKRKRTKINIDTGYDPNGTDGLHRSVRMSSSSSSSSSSAKNGSTDDDDDGSHDN